MPYYGYKTPYVRSPQRSPCPPVCRNYANGFCRNGQNCDFSHIRDTNNHSMQNYNGEGSSSTNKSNPSHRSDPNSSRTQSSNTSSNISSNISTNSSSNTSSDINSTNLVTTTSSFRSSNSHNSHSRRKTKICEFFLQNRCRFGDDCWNKHEIQEIPEMPETTVIEVLENKEVVVEHKKKEKQKEKEEEENICSICYDTPQIFGLLVHCDHVFCRDCIKEWRKTDNLSSPFQTIDTTKTCPVCRKNSPYIVPSQSFAKSGSIKDQIISSYRERLAQIPCKYFQDSKKCPFADECHYKHANPDGSRCILGPPRKKKPRSVRQIGNFRYLEVSGESSGFDISTISEILGGLTRNRSFRHIFAGNWGDEWDDEMDFTQPVTWDDEFPFDDQFNDVTSFSPENQSGNSEGEDIPEVINGDNSGWSTWDDCSPETFDDNNTSFADIFRDENWWQGLNSL
ncbi:hypothetical protein Glove_485g22 [Diversispora epigaea]|uniref:RING-type E3 ubiquitin transferase n=1 Tax=Diversispora epigaea TaxID=1348612 RepID=A0A397GPV2_9GLOM|nr:hypothetical protein Glove_485g22 [Diversispora epigaea]